MRKNFLEKIIVILTFIEEKMLLKKPKVRSVSVFHFRKIPKPEVFHFFTSEKTQNPKCFTFLLRKNPKVRSVSFFTSEKTQSQKCFNFLLRKKLKV